MPKHNRLKNYRKKNRQNNKPYRTIILAVLLFIVVLFCTVLVLVKSMNTLQGLVLVRQYGSGAEILILKSREEGFRYIIPKNTQLELANSLGVYKLESAWILAEKEKLRGELIAKSLMKNFYFPVYYWETNTSSNLNLFQKIGVRLIGENNLKVINLSETLALKEKRLTDGSMGYVVNSKIPDSLLVNFSNNRLDNKLLIFEVEDLSQSSKTVTLVSKLIEVMGGKITSYSKGYNKDLDCEIIGSNKETATYIAKIFDCKVKIDPSNSSDIKLTFGALFSQRY